MKKKEKKNVYFVRIGLLALEHDIYILLVQFWLLSGHLLGNSCPLGKQFVLIVVCLFVIFIYFPF